MGYVYGGLWFLLAILLYVRFRGEGKIIYVLSGYFIIMGIWWVANQMIEGVNLMTGMYGWIFRGISAVMLIALVIVYIYDRRLKQSSDSSDRSESSSKSE
ncbi:MAG: hypothetical protein II711_01570 [Clostridia bacterium]|nr:hypothetical protein [Clostridia bacterium]